MSVRIRRAIMIGSLLALESAAATSCGRGADEGSTTRSRGGANRIRIEIVASGLAFPSSINFAPDGRLFVLERGDVDRETGAGVQPRLRRLDLQTGVLDEISGLPETRIYPNVPGATVQGGALGLELDRDFATNRRLYLCYHYGVPSSQGDLARNRLSAFRVEGKRLVHEQILVDDVPGDSVYNGCRVISGPDGMLYYATGSPAPFTDSQDLASNAGKILRLRPDGQRPDDNPFPNSLVYSYGHRNPQGLAFDPATHALWSTEHGPDSDDELNRIEAGRNYGWPRCGGEAKLDERWGVRRTELCAGLDPDDYRPARKSFYPDRTLAISDLTFYDGDAFPDWRGHILVTTLKAERLLRLELDGGRVVERPDLIHGRGAERYGRLRDVTVGPDGFIYVATNPRAPRNRRIRLPNARRGTILRIRPGESSTGAVTGRRAGR